MRCSAVVALTVAATAVPAFAAPVMAREPNWTTDIRNGINNIIDRGKLPGRREDDLLLIRGSEANGLFSGEDATLAREPVSYLDDLYNALSGYILSSKLPLCVGKDTDGDLSAREPIHLE